jgi:ribonuclease P protein component
VAIPKRHHKKSVERHLIKRRILEAYRTSGRQLLEAKVLKEGFHINLAILYTGGVKNSDFSTLEPKLIEAIERLARKSLSQPIGENVLPKASPLPSPTTVSNAQTPPSTDSD